MDTEKRSGVQDGVTPVDDKAPWNGHWKLAERLYISPLQPLFVIIQPAFNKSKTVVVLLESLSTLMSLY